MKLVGHLYLLLFLLAGASFLPLNVEAVSAVAAQSPVQDEEITLSSFFSQERAIRSTPRHRLIGLENQKVSSNKTSKYRADACKAWEMDFYLGLVKAKGIYEYSELFHSFFNCQKRLYLLYLSIIN